MRDTQEIESAIGVFAQKANGGLIILGSALASVHRDLIIKLANRHRLPAVFSDRLFVDAGGLISYGPDRADQFRRAAAYVDRILKGEKPADLPVRHRRTLSWRSISRPPKRIGLDSAAYAPRARRRGD